MARWKLILILLVNLFAMADLTVSVGYNIPDPDCTGVFNLCTDADKERLGRLAIKAIHEQMDDDKDGMIEASETSDFIQEELESKTDSDRHHRFQNEDLQITMEDLWDQWRLSSVYNWTNDQVIDWLVNHVHLPMYVDNFRRNQIDGRMIPRIAVNEKHYLSAIMQIRDLRHKRRLVIKATDIILFGPPKQTQNLAKDVILISALVISFGACLYAFVRHRKTQEHMKNMRKNLETLQNAEHDLDLVRKRMEAMEDDLRQKISVDRTSLNSWFHELQKSKNEADSHNKSRISNDNQEKQLFHAIKEAEHLRAALRKAEDCAVHQSFQPPNELVELLQRTCIYERAALEVKRQAAENAMLLAKEEMGKINRMQRGIFGAVRIAHTGCIEKIGDLINSTKEHMSEVRKDYEQSEQRWNRIALLAGIEDFFNDEISTNNIIIPTVSSVSLRLREPLFRSKQSSFETNSLNSSSNESPKTNRRTSNGNRSYLQNSSTIDEFAEPSRHGMTIRRRTLMENTMMDRRPSFDRLQNLGTISNSSQNVSEANGTVFGMPRTKTFSSIESTITNKPVFDLNCDVQSDSVDFEFGEVIPRERCRRQSVFATGNPPIASQDKMRKSFRNSKIYKSFTTITQWKKKMNE